MSRIAICVCTYRRPDWLDACLTGLAAQKWHRPDPPELEVIVVENEADGPGQAICQSQSALALRYAVEERRGIPWARNKCLDLAAEGADFIAFIDDDEVPDPRWLEHLWTTQQASGADIVCGPVHPLFSAPPPAWLRRGGFHDPQTTETGQPPAFCATNNVLFRADLVRKLGLRFDKRLVGMGVGEDVLFFTQAIQAGCRAVWCAEALVWETIPVERMTARWLIRRAYRIGICDSVVARAAQTGAAATLWAGMGRVIAHGLLLPVSLISGKGGVVRRLRGLGYGLGRLVGWRFQGAGQ